MSKGNGWISKSGFWNKPFSSDIFYLTHLINPFLICSISLSDIRKSVKTKTSRFRSQREKHFSQNQNRNFDQ